MEILCVNRIVHHSVTAGTQQPTAGVHARCPVPQLSFESCIVEPCGRLTYALAKLAEAVRSGHKWTRFEL
jgi:hypothetical protein